MIKQVGHICIGSTDLAATKHFYGDILGMKITFEFLKNGELYGFYLASGNMTFIEVFTQDAIDPNPRPGMKHICLEVENLDEVIATVRERGGTVTDKKLGGDNSWQAWIKDPSGVDIEFMQYTDKSSHFTGAPCIVTW
jgi:glyoxylase I family protein